MFLYKDIVQWCDQNYVDPDPYRTLRFTQKNGFIFIFIHSIVSLHNFMFLISGIGDIILNILDSM